MFNTKRIIFLIGLLSIVALTGALMAGPAFAAKGGVGSKGAGAHDSMKNLVCHLNSEIDAGPDGVLNSVDPTSTDDLAAGWYLDDVDEMSLAKHLGHGDIEVDGTIIVSDAALEAFCMGQTVANSGFDYQGDNRDA